VKNLALNKRTRGFDLRSRCLNCTNFGKLILRKIIKIAATRCHILKLKCTKFDFGWGSAPDPAREPYSAPTDPLARFKRPTSKGRGGEGTGREERGGQDRGGQGERAGREREGREGKGRGPCLEVFHKY